METTEATDSDKESEELVINDVEGKLCQILARLHNLEEKSRTESNERVVLIADNMKMAAQIEQLKSTISLLRETKTKTNKNKNKNKMLGLMSNVQNSPILTKANQSHILFLLKIDLKIFQ